MRCSLLLAEIRRANYRQVSSFANPSACHFLRRPAAGSRKLVGGGARDAIRRVCLCVRVCVLLRTREVVCVCVRLAAQLCFARQSQKCRAARLFEPQLGKVSRAKKRRLIYSSRRTCSRATEIEFRRRPIEFAGNNRLSCARRRVQLSPSRRASLKFARRFECLAAATLNSLVWPPTWT